MILLPAALYHIRGDVVVAVGAEVGAVVTVTLKTSALTVEVATVHARIVRVGVSLDGAGAANYTDTVMKGSGVRQDEGRGGEGDVLR